LIRTLFFLFLFLTGELLLAQQSKQSLERRRNRLSKQIENTSRLLEETRKNKSESIDLYYLLQNQVEDRAVMIREIRQEVDSLSDLIQEKNISVNEMDLQIEALKKSFRKVIVQQYLMKKNAKPLWYHYFSGTINTFVRYHYLIDQLQKISKSQLMRLNKLAKATVNELLFLHDKSEVKKALLEEENIHRLGLEEEMKIKNQLVVELKSKEKSLSKLLDEKEKQKKALNQRIEQIIRAQQEAALRRAKQSKKRNQRASTPTVSNSNYPAGDPLVKMRGKLPHPVSGQIIARFGKQKHPLYEGVFTQNNGVDYKTSGPVSVKAVFPGEVVAVFELPGSGKAVILRHGEFFTTYSNLQETTVSRGQTVQGGKQLGTNAKSEKGYYLLHFEFWFGKNKENPEIWLR
jgi:septal ring factor EnvC (AmiA/AmiB activator)